jgi:hypothetical protein
VTGSTPPAVLADLWMDAGGDPGALARVRLGGDDPVLPGVFRVGAAALASIGAAGLAAAELLRLRTGRTQTVSVDVRRAAAAFRRSIAQLLVKHGADHRARNRRGAQPLHYAADTNIWNPLSQAGTIEYLISIGADPNAEDKDGTTPLGTFTVRNKMVDPTYYGPEGVIAHDDPRNPLGERWIDIGDGYGIHGTIEPASIGRNESRGCIRLLNSDVEEVYDFLVVGSEVKIER